jgi:cytochrome b subunit of formate dehydrogenase
MLTFSTENDYEGYDYNLWHSAMRLFCFSFAASSFLIRMTGLCLTRQLFSSGFVVEAERLALMALSSFERMRLV